MYISHIYFKFSSLPSEGDFEELNDLKGKRSDMSSYLKEKGELG